MLVVVVTEPSVFVVEVVDVAVFVPSDAVVVVVGELVVDVLVDVLGFVPVPMQTGVPPESTPACTVPPGQLPLESAGVLVFAGFASDGLLLPASEGALDAGAFLPSETAENVQ